MLPAALFGSASGTEWMEGEAKLSAIYVQEGEGGRGAAKEEDAAEEDREGAVLVQAVEEEEEEEREEEQEGQVEEE